VLDPFNRFHPFAPVDIVQPSWQVSQWHGSTPPGYGRGKRNSATASSDTKKQKGHRL
jgi:hypothetical protein